MNATPQDQNLQQRSGGAPKGNANRLRHGLTAAKLPKGCEYISNRVGQFRKQLEAEVIATHGEIGVYFAALIQSATRHEVRAKLLSRWLRESENEIKTTTSKGSTNGSGTTSEATVTRTTLSILEKASLLRDISAASDNRDKCLEKLNLSQLNETPWFPSLPKPTTSENPPESTADNKPDESPTDAATRPQATPQGSLTEVLEQ